MVADFEDKPLFENLLQHLAQSSSVDSLAHTPANPGM
jgi:hypothetical protein